MALLEQYNNAIEALVDLYESLEGLNAAQEAALKEYYDIRGIPYNLKYGYIRSENLYVFAMNKDAFKRWEYYLGMEYIRDEINFYIEFEGDVIVGYNECDRISGFYDKIDENEELDEDEEEEFYE